MPKHVFILGAGASYDAGAPLMSNFLDRAEDYLSQNRLSLAVKDIRRLFELRSRMRLVYANSTLDLQNIESLLSALEMGVTIGGIGDYSRQRLTNLLKAAELMIVQTIEESVEFEIVMGEPVQMTGAGQVLLSLKMPEQYANFINRVHKRFDKDVAFVTFNYDVALDLCLLAAYGQVSYCLSGLPSDADAIPVCKLHGSVNWAIHPSTRTFDVVQLGKFLKPLSAQHTRGDKLRLRFSSDFNTRFGGKYRPIIVPPTWNKTARHRSIPHVWSSASHYLRNATHIYVIGYSLPSSDAFFQHMFALSTMQNDRIRRLVVTDIDDNVEKRFHALIGPGILSRFSFDKRSFDDAGRYSGIKIFE
jgi:hypothetical protein